MLVEGACQATSSSDVTWGHSRLARFHLHRAPSKLSVLQTIGLYASQAELVRPGNGDTDVKRRLSGLNLIMLLWIGWGCANWRSFWKVLGIRKQLNLGSPDVVESYAWPYLLVPAYWV